MITWNLCNKKCLQECRAVQLVCTAMLATAPPDAANVTPAVGLHATALPLLRFLHKAHYHSLKVFVRRVASVERGVD